MMRRLRLSHSAWKRLAKKINGQSSKLKWRTGLAYHLCGVAYSSLLSLQNASHTDALRTVTPYPPLFILGFWRSGTTLLHELFCCDPQFGFPSTYACLNPSHFLLTEHWSKARNTHLAVRPMDAMSYSWASPQEDEFALFALGAPSPYEALIVPSLMREPRRLLDLRLSTSEEQRFWANALQSFLRLLTVQQRKTMVLKSPPHGFRLPLLLSLFPKARYVVIERNPYEVFVSNLKLWRTLLDLYAVESWTDEEIETFVLAAYLIHEEALTEGRRLVSSQRLACVRYEDLITDPIREMERLYGELDLLSFGQVRESVEAYARANAGHRRNQFVMSREQKARIESAWGPLMQAKGYYFPEQYLRLEN